MVFLKAMVAVITVVMTIIIGTEAALSRGIGRSPLYEIRCRSETIGVKSYLCETEVVDHIIWQLRHRNREACLSAQRRLLSQSQSNRFKVSTRGGLRSRRREYR